MSSKLSIVFAIWIGLVAASLLLMLMLDFKPGTIGPAKTNSAVKLSRTACLKVFLHPQCGCSHATVASLRSIICEQKVRLKSEIYFYAPRGASDAFVHNRLWQEATLIPGSHLVEDVDGAEARSFGAYTSGTVELFDASTGKLSFIGGITPGRGQYGLSGGAEAIRDCLSGRAAPKTAPVYGCAIVPSGERN